MNAGPETQLDAVNSRGVGVRVALRRIGDRFAHTISGIRRDRIDAIVESVEDADYQGWPLSPPLQELRDLTDAAGNHSLLLLGSAAYGHWSATIRSARSAHFAKEDPYLEFDIAVRLHRAPAYLGIAYQAVTDASWLEMPSGLTFAKRGPHAMGISAPLNEAVAFSTPPSDLLKAFVGETSPTRRVFLPATPLPGNYPATYRWRYWIAAALSK